MADASITVVTPCLDSAGTIGETLASVASQLAPGDEHLVVDGGSSDGTIEILEAHPHVRYVSEPDRGLADAMNKGIRLARGELVGWLNADDVLLPGALEAVRAAARERPDAGWITAPCLIIDEDGREIRRAITAYKRALLRLHSHRWLLVQNYIASPATYVRKPLYERVGPFDERYRYSMDYDMWLRLAAAAEPVVLDQPLAAFRMAGESLSMTGFEAQFAEHARNAREHGAGHPVAVAANRVISALIVFVYRVLRWRRGKRA